jgi:hypothetical protein
VQLGALRGPPAARPGDNLKPIGDWTNKDRLKHTSLSDRVRQLGDCIFIEMYARLNRARLNATNFNLANAIRARRCRVRCWRRCSFTQESLKAAAKARCRLAAHAATASRGRRAMSSRAKLT